MGCKHNYVFTQGYFYCTKCGHRRYGKTHRNRQGKKIALAIIIPVIAIGIGFLFYSGILEINQENLEQSIQSIPTKLPEIPLKMPEIPEVQEIQEIVPIIQGEVQRIQEQPKKIIQPQLNITKIELLVHQGINQQRNLHGLESLDYDEQIADIARMHSQDMADNNYFDHVSLSGKEPWDRGFPYGYDTCGTKEAIALQKKYDELSAEYDKYPAVVSHSQYQEAMKLYNQLNSIGSQLDEHIKNGELFGGLAENIHQNWLYEYVYAGGIPADWNTEEELAQQAVEGWMNSPGHRENILSGFHSEGIGIAIAEDDKVYVTQNFC